MRHSHRREGFVQRISAACAASAVIGAASSTSAETWDFAEQFSNSGNPNGVWTYAHMNTDFTGFTPLENPVGDASAIGWNSPSCANMWKNLTNGSPFGNPPQHVSLHPGCGNEPCVARWTAPNGVTSPVDVTGQFLAGDSGSMGVAVHLNGATLWSATNAGAFDLSVPVVPGDVIDFLVYGGFAFGNTPLELAISTGESPCPADLNHDGQVSGLDITILLSDWGTSGSPADLSGDGTVNGADITFLLGSWGPCPSGS